MAQTVTDIVLDFVLEHYISTSRVQGKKAVRVIRSDLSSGAAKVLMQYLVAQGFSEDEAVSRLKARFDSVLAAQTRSRLGLHPRFDNTRLYVLCGAALMLAGVIGLLWPGTEKFFYGCMLLMGVILLWTGFDPLPRAMTRIWAEKCTDADGMTLEDLNALHALVQKTARKGTLST